MTATARDHIAPFKAMRPFQGVAPPEFCMDWLGIKTRASFLNIPGAENPRQVAFDYPAIDDEYFEYLDVLEAINLARDRFVMFELGAGYGRWCLVAEAMLRVFRTTLPRQFTAVEAEPTHFAFLRDHFRDNGLDPEGHRLVEAAVTGTGGEVFFAVGDPANWWGQAIVPQYSEHKHVAVPAVTLSSLLEGQGVVDLIDMDVQGAELDVIAESIGAVDSQVKRLHIGTHGKDIEAGLRELLATHGWHCRHDYSLQKESRTPLGVIRFGDGVQSWINPRLVRPASVAQRFSKLWRNFGRRDV